MLTKLSFIVIVSSLYYITIFSFLCTAHLFFVKVKILMICVKIWKDKPILMENQSMVTWSEEWGTITNCNKGSFRDARNAFISLFCSDGYIGYIHVKSH